MARIYGINGVGTGKIGNTILSVRYGEQIARQYQPIVSNPSTAAQVSARARLKLLSQLAAVMAPVIAMRRLGPVSSRNRFVSVNYHASSYTGNQAEITLTDVKLTKSVVSLPAISASRDGNSLTVQLTQGVLDLDRVVYVAFFKQADGTLRYADSVVVNAPGTIGHWEGTISVLNVNTVVYAYGVRENSDTARATFGDMQVLSAETIAKLLVNSTLTDVDVTLTETQAIEVAATA